MHILLLHNLVGPVCSLSLEGGGKCAAEVLSSKERMQPKGAGAPVLVPPLEKCTPPSMPHNPPCQFRGHPSVAPQVSGHFLTAMLQAQSPGLWF